MRRRPDPLLVTSTLAAIVAVIVAMIAELRAGWTAMGDHAQVLLRSRDVFTSHTPLVGQRSSSGVAFDFELNNPGPLLYYLFALPARLWGDAGLVVATAVLAIACILGIAYVLDRRAGPVVATLGLVAVAGLGWTMGRLVVDPLQPHSLLHPFLLFLVLGWATSAGDEHLLPWAAGVATLLVQSHLTYAYVVPAIGLAALSGLLVGAVRIRRARPRRWPARRRALVRAGVVSGAVLVVLWLPAIVEQVRASGRGNLALVLEAARAGAPTVPVHVAVGRSAAVLALWPTWLRPSFLQDWVHTAPPGLGASIGALAALGAVLALAGWWAWRRHDRFAFAGVVVAAIAAAAAVYNATGTIETPFEVAHHHVRYLWPTAITIQLAVAVVVVRSLGPLGARRVGVAATALVVVLSAANLPAYQQQGEGGVGRELGAVVRAMNAQLDTLEDSRVVLVEFTRVPFPDPFLHAFVAELGRRRIDFVVQDAVSVRRYGEGREYEGHADAVAFLRWGSDALEEVPDAELVAFASLLDEEEIDAWQRVDDEVRSAIAGDGLVLTPSGRRAAEDSRLDLPVTDDGIGVEPRAIYMGDAFERALGDGWVRVRGVPSETLEEWYTDLRTLERSTIAVWLMEPVAWARITDDPADGRDDTGNVARSA